MLANLHRHEGKKTGSSLASIQLKVTPTLIIETRETRERREKREKRERIQIQ
jgi:hypothetical protein